MGITRYTWDVTTDSVLQESDGMGAVQATYTRRPDVYGPLLSQHRSGTTSYYHYDALGSTRALTDDSQSVNDSYTHDAWGNEVASSGSTVNTQRWGGRLGCYDDPAAIGGYYIRARNYQPNVARWISVDPIGMAGGIHLYKYCSSSPITRIDPLGLVDENPACRGCDAAAAACVGIAVTACILDLAEALECINHFFPKIRIWVPACPPYRITVTHPCVLFQPPRSPARIACCLGFAALECSIKMALCYAAWVQCRQLAGCNPPPPMT